MSAGEIPQYSVIFQYKLPLFHPVTTHYITAKVTVLTNAYNQLFPHGSVTPENINKHIRSIQVSLKFDFLPRVDQFNTDEHELDQS